MYYTANEFYDVDLEYLRCKLEPCMMQHAKLSV